MVLDDCCLALDTLEPDLYHKTQSLAEKTKQHLHEKVKTTHITKFTQLQRPPTSNIPEANNTTNPKTVINLSSKPLTPSQTSLLAKGLKYVPVTAKINTDAFITSIESGLQQLAPNGNVDYFRHQIIDTIKQAPKPRSSLTHQERQAITELKKDDTITITEADKGKAAVIMDTPEFLQLVNNSLSDTTTYLNIKKDPTARLERQQKKTPKDLHEKREINDIIFNQLNPINSQAPYGRATIKIHKNPPKARILVCSRGSVFYNTAQFLSRLLAPFGKDGKSYISDSSSFVNQLKESDLTDTMVSYDVVDLFTNIPLEEALDILGSKLANRIDDLDTHLTIHSIINFARSYFDTSYFTFNAPFQPLCWYRKVDDTFTTITNDNDPSELFNHLNDQHPRIKFTMETETNQHLPFLDVSLHTTADGLRTSVYRKPTHTDQCW
ncbi:uncharacterized protein [Haliotis asinina]|uniref:uncharacterized protein n=1 Tax=Haliotis asinina TaxID=109174 RepID=UPI0035323FD6